jgi:hypothetical protein
MLLLVTLAGGGGCSGYPPPTPALPGRTPADQADRKLLLRYGQELEYRTRLGAADLQYVDDGVLVAIEPQVGAAKISEAELEDGRIVARFHKGSGGSLPRFALTTEDTVSYWLVYRKNGQYYGRFFSAGSDTTYRITVDWHDGRPGGHEGEDEMLRHNLGWKQAIAQWRIGAPYIQGGPARKGGVNAVPVVAKLGAAWVTCSAFGCCKTD